MGLVDELLGCPLLEITRSYWAVKLTTGEWVCEARVKTDLYKGIERHFDWAADLVGNEDVLKITELWLLCPPSRTSPLGNTARLVITEPGTAFQFKVGNVDSNIASTSRNLEVHIIGKVTNKENGDCEIFAWDAVQQGLVTPDTEIYDPRTGGRRRDPETGGIMYAGRNNIYNFHGWRESLPDKGRLELRTLGVRV